jgi:hypothetical protein
MTPANDCAGTEYSGNSKSWFHFRINNVPANMTIKMIVRNLHMLASNVMELMTCRRNFQSIIEQYVGRRVSSGNAQANALLL